MKQVLLIGSGRCADRVRQWPAERFQGLEVCAINNAWTLPKKLNYHIFAGDWRPAAGRPQDLSAENRISFRQYDSPPQHERFGKQGVGIGATMFFNAAYWVLGNLQPDRIFFIGCSMDYPQGQANTFYGTGTPDPLRFKHARLVDWFSQFEATARRQGCELINLGSPFGLMPW